MYTSPSNKNNVKKPKIAARQSRDLKRLHHRKRHKVYQSRQTKVEATLQSCSGSSCELAAEGLRAVLVHQQPTRVASPKSPSDLEMMPEEKKIIMMDQ